MKKTETDNAHMPDVKTRRETLLKNISGTGRKLFIATNMVAFSAMVLYGLSVLGLIGASHLLQ